jgi:hypothetical protein
MPVPDFSPGEVLTAAAMDSIGMWLVKTVTVGAGVSQVDLTSVFSNTYDNYLVTLRANSATGAVAILMQYGTGTPVATNYKSFLNTTFASWTSGAVTSVTSTTGSIITFGHTTNVTGISNVFGPNLAVNTTAFGSYATDTNGGTTAGIQTDNTQFTSLHIVTAGTITGGTIRVYGYRN